MMFPLVLIFVLPMIAWMHFAQNPDGWPAIALSLFPPTAPMVMILRIAVRRAECAVENDWECCPFVRCVKRFPQAPFRIPCISGEAQKFSPNSPIFRPEKT